MLRVKTHLHPGNPHGYRRSPLTLGLRGCIFYPYACVYRVTWKHLVQGNEMVIVVVEYEQGGDEVRETAVMAAVGDCLFVLLLHLITDY